MQKKLNITNNGEGYFSIEGELTFATIDKKIAAQCYFLNTSKEIILDLKAVTNTDSAGLALMIEWVKYCRQHRTILVFKNVPQQLQQLAKLSGFDKTNQFNFQTN